MIQGKSSRKTHNSGSKSQNDTSVRGLKVYQRKKKNMVFAVVVIVEKESNT